ncbi:L-2-hydroxyglutarate oxidase [Alteromonas sp. ASW11-130]|uniref:L-2-hydroxyglutarate oxidase n=1 Tax=Alteromonas sp. ASW11-130 TaxID=3015775 RepID=UPI002242587A|nr:L-2-hydroxyglutarate oxidase [Alteromonas sp. ASW11-130]MCW8092167.1 L-2-hydroxyglutarate oxidase [Alteromonas sp. ASW11-130]
MKLHFDFIVVGAGIVGAAVARQLAIQFPTKSIAIIEKEAKPAQHQSGRNSGVIHAGVYYPPESLKAQYCIEGLGATIELCEKNNLPFEQCGKIVVATNSIEEARLARLFHRCQLNGLAPRMLTKEQIGQKEPNISGTAGMWVKQTGITDFKRVTQCLLEKASDKGNITFYYSTEVDAIDETAEGMHLSLIQGKRTISVRGDLLVSCAGVYADALIRKQGLPCDFRIVPFRGEYYRLRSRFDTISNRLIYPVPDPAMPFLGVHLTKMIGGYTTVGPNAVLAAGREAYSGLKIDLLEWMRLASFPGLYKLLWHLRGNVVSELKTSFSKKQYIKQVRRYCRYISEDDLLPYRPGIRAQAVTLEGELLHDFKFVGSERALHVGNAPSPAATSAIPIAKAIVSKLIS